VLSPVLFDELAHIEKPYDRQNKAKYVNYIHVLKSKHKVLNVFNKIYMDHTAGNSSFTAHQYA
jgi:hypothetical protein